jgi:hypothetical protein
LETGKITSVGSLRIGAGISGTLVGRGEQEYYFDQPSSDDEKMAQAAILLETLAIGNVPVSPMLGTVMLAIVETLNGGSGADAILTDHRYSAGVEGAAEGRIEAGFKTELFSAPFARIANIALPEAEAQLAFSLGLDWYYQDPYLRSRGVQRYFQDLPPDERRFKVYADQAAEFDFTALSLSIGRGLPVDMELPFIPRIAYQYHPMVEEAAYFDEDWGLLGIELTFESDATQDIMAIDHDIMRHSIFLPRENLDRFIDDIETNATSLARSGASSAEPLGDVILGRNAAREDAATMLVQALNNALQYELMLPYEVTKSDEQVLEAEFRMELGVAVGVGIFVPLGADFRYVDSREYLMEAGHLVSAGEGFLKTSTYPEDSYVNVSPELGPKLLEIIDGIWPLIETALTNLMDWAGDVIAGGWDWATGWWPAGMAFVANGADGSWMKVSGNGDELPVGSRIQVTKYDPRFADRNALRFAYRSNRIAHESPTGVSLTTDGLLVGLGSCYQVNGKSSDGAEIPTFVNPADMTFLVSSRDLTRAGLSTDLRPRVRIYHFLSEGNSWQGVSDPLGGSSDTLRTQISSMGTYMLGIEFLTDASGPSINGLIPAPNEILRSLDRLSAVLADDDSGVDLARTQVLIDSIPYRVQVDAESLRVSIAPEDLPLLPVGGHEATWIAFDRFGNRTVGIHAFCISALPTPENLIADGQDERVELGWNAPPDPAVIGTLVRYSSTGFPLTPESGDPVPNEDGGRFSHSPGQILAFTHIGLSNGTHYYYSAWSYDQDSWFSSVIHASGLAWDHTPPEPVTDFTAVGEDSQVRLEWDCPATPDVAGVLIRFSNLRYPADSSDGSPVPNGSDGLFAAGPGEAGAFLHVGLSNGVRYYYSIFAHDEVGNPSSVMHAEAMPGDYVSPDLVIGILQNPYLTRYVDIFLVGSEPIGAGNPPLCSCDQTDLVVRPSGDTGRVWMADYELTGSSGIHEIYACTADTAGNERCMAATFSAAFMRKSSGGTLTSPGGALEVRVPPETMKQDGYLIVFPISVTESVNVSTGGSSRTLVAGLPGPEGLRTSYLVSPSEALADGQVELTLHYDAAELPPGITPDQLCLVREDGTRLDSYIDPDRSTVTALTSDLGLVRLSIDQPGSSQREDPRCLRLETPAPNPFRSSTTMRFETAGDVHLRAEVFDASGGLVSILHDGIVGPGRQTLTWDGRGSNGLPAAAGVYFVKLRTDARAVTSRVLLVR